MAQTGEAAARPEAPAPAAAGKNEQRRQTIENALKKRQRFSGVEYEKMAYSRSLAKYVLFLRSETVFSMMDFLSLEAFLKKELTALPENLRIVLHQPGEPLLGDGALLEKQVQEFMIACEPAL
ncbi:MAG: hypothetical protein KHW46_06075, partial [Clostridiales bacterium]|nr:hypothetical protein [Clostridiales bacterium]